jgi:hypothetical protein
MHTPFLQSEKVQINTTSILWLGLTTLLALVITLVGGWGMNTSARVDATNKQIEVVDQRVDDVVTKQAVDTERFKVIQMWMAEFDKKMDQVLEEQKRARK